MKKIFRLTAALPVMVLWGVCAPLSAAVSPYTDAGSVQTTELGNALFKWTEPLNKTVVWPATRIDPMPGVEIRPATPVLGGLMAWQQNAADSYIWNYQWLPEQAAQTESSKWGFGQSGFSSFPQINFVSAEAAPVFAGFPNPAGTSVGNTASLLVSFTDAALFSAMKKAGFNVTVAQNSGDDCADIVFDQTDSLLKVTGTQIGTAQYTVTLVGASGKWESANTSLNVTVAGAPGTVLVWKTAPASRVYNGLPISGFEAEALDSAKIKEDSLSYAFMTPDSVLLAGAPKNIGHYIVRATAEPADGVAPPPPLDGAFTISPKSAVLVWSRSDWNIPYASVDSLPSVHMVTGDTVPGDNLVLPDGVIGPGFAQFTTPAGSSFNVSPLNPTGSDAFNYTWTPPAAARYDIVKNSALTAVITPAVQSTATAGQLYTVVPPVCDSANWIAPTYTYTTLPAYPVNNGTFTPALPGTVAVTAVPASPNFEVPVSVEFNVAVAYDSINYADLLVSFTHDGTQSPYDANPKSLKVLRNGQPMSPLRAAYEWTVGGNTADTTVLLNAGAYKVKLESDTYLFVGIQPVLEIIPVSSQLVIRAPASVVYGHDFSAFMTATNMVGADSIAVTPALSNYKVWVTGTADAVTVRSVAPSAMGVGLLTNYRFVNASDFPVTVTAANFAVVNIDSPVTGYATTSQTFRPELDFTGFSAETEGRPSPNFTVTTSDTAGVYVVNTDPLTLNYLKPTLDSLVLTVSAPGTSDYSVLDFETALQICKEKFKNGIVWLSLTGEGSGTYDNPANAERLSEAVQALGVTEARILEDVISLKTDLDFTAKGDSFVKVSSGWNSQTAQDDAKAVRINGSVILDSGITLDKLMVDASDTGKIFTAPANAKLIRCTVKVRSLIRVNASLYSSVIFGAPVQLGEGVLPNVKTSALESPDAALWGLPLEQGSDNFWLAPEGTPGAGGFFAPKMDGDLYPLPGSVLINRGAFLPSQP